MFAKKQSLATLASVMLLVFVVAGKVGTDLTKASSPDTAVLLLQFVAVIFFLEASRVVLSFDQETSELEGRTDQMSQAIRERLDAWVRAQLGRQARLIVGVLGLSLVLLVIGGFTSVSINQIAFSAILVLLVVGALLFLITQRREPDTGQVGLR
jgi:protein-S-isoprenylcysteine O-methyltransferase Ste14